MPGDDDSGNHANKHDGSGRLKKNMSKMAFRSKEMMLRTLGRTDETKDEIIDNYIHLVNKQQIQAQKFLRELKLYISSIQAMKHASASFYQSISGIYEESWSGHDVISGLHKRSDELYDQLHHKLNDVIIHPLTLYSHQCNEIRVKVNKRGRKLVDFDAARRNYHQIQGAKKVDDVKLKKKAKEQMNISGRKYEDLNAELHQQLPDLYDARVLLFANIVTDISTAENCFYGEMSEVRGKLLLMAETLKENFSHGGFHIQRLYSPKYPKEEIENDQSNDAATLPCSDRLTSSDAASYRTDDVTCDQGSPSNQESNYVNVITFPIPSQSRDDDVTDDVTNLAANKMAKKQKEKKTPIAAPRLTPTPPKSSPPDSALDDEDTSDTSDEESVNEAAAEVEEGFQTKFRKFFQKTQQQPSETNKSPLSRLLNRKSRDFSDDKISDVPYDESPFVAKITKAEDPIPKVHRSAPPKPPGSFSKGKVPVVVTSKSDDDMKNGEKTAEDDVTMASHTDESAIVYDVIKPASEGSNDVIRLLPLNSEVLKIESDDVITNSTKAVDDVITNSRKAVDDVITNSTKAVDEDVTAISEVESLNSGRCLDHKDTKSDDVTSQSSTDESDVSEFINRISTDDDDDVTLNEKLLSHHDSPMASPSHDHVTKEVIETNDKTKQLGNNGILPPHYIYTVQAQHRYTGEDNDELSFEKNDVIYVVEFPDPDEQDEGWQMGVLKSAWDCDVSMATRGLFPENFTKKI